jgi:hypothetical protein
MQDYWRCVEFEYIKKHAIESAIGGIENVVKCRVPEKELMIVSRFIQQEKQMFGT